MVDDEDFERETGQLFSGDDPLLVTAVGVCGGLYGVVLAPSDATAALHTLPSIGADGRLVEPPARALPMRDGLAVFPIDSPQPKVTVSRAGVQLASAVLLGTGLGPAVRGLPKGEVERAAREAPGDADPGVVAAAVSMIDSYLERAVADRPTGVRVLWGGQLPNGSPVALAAVHLPSGADCIGNARAYRIREYQSTLTGLLPAGRLDRTLVSWQDNDYVVVVARQATRAEVELPGGTVLPVPLIEGGGSVQVPKGVRARAVRAYAADGALIGKQAPGTGLLPLPGR
jgi:hypothetical protein